ncbi:MAG: hypothetical protein Q9217_007033 [Psora testacea]
MVFKKKPFHPPSRKVLESQQKFNTADDYLEAGVALEEAGEKRRAGDAAISLGFFSKAIDTARLQLDVAQQPQLFTQLPTPLIDLLRVAAESHSLAEAVLDHEGHIREKRAEASRLLHRSLGFFERCLKAQESQHEQAQQLKLQHPQVFKQADPNSSHTMSSTPGEATEEELWATIVEPVTPDTLLDTCLAELEVLKALCDSLSAENADELTRIERDFRDNLSNKISTYGQLCERRRDIALSKSSFLCSIANSRYRLGISDLTTYEQDFNTAILDVERHSSNDAQALCMIAEARIDFNSSIEERLHYESHPSSGDLTRVCALRWRHITQALDLYTTASKVCAVSNLARIHISRGDCEMLRIRLGEAPFIYQLAQRSEDTLVKNASVFYGAATKVLSCELISHEAREDRIEVDAKAAVVAAWLARDPEVLKVFLKGKGRESWQTFEEMRDQGLLGEKSWKELEKLLRQA